jgi:hypothetical protein
MFNEYNKLIELSDFVEIIKKTQKSIFFEYSQTVMKNHFIWKD